MSGKENSAGLGVNNRYGARVLPEGKAGVFKTVGNDVQYVLNFRGADIAGDDVETPIIPKGFKPTAVYIGVRRAPSAHTGVISIGTDGSEATNGFEVGSVTLATVGEYALTTFAGTWNATTGLVANTTIGVAALGTITGGEYEITIVGRRGSHTH